MATRTSRRLPLLAIVATLLLSAVASAQIDDWPALKGDNHRLGYTLDYPNGPYNNGAGNTPGVANLRWWTPSSLNSQYTTALVIDNTDNTTDGYTNPYGFFTVYPTPIPNAAPPLTPSTNAWQPDPLSQNANYTDATNPWLEYNPNTVTNEREPAYDFSYTTPAELPTTPNYQPYIAQTASALHTASWTFTPGTGTPNLYALYVWLPVGPQVSGTTVTSTSEIFPQEFYVYTITINGRVYTDVVDSYLSGGGWVRLGNGGSPTNMVFPYDGVNPITITLYNTIPYNSSGQLTGSTSQVVYADAAEAVPTNGYYDASPTSAQLTVGGVSQGSQTTRTVAALSQFSSGGIGNSFTTIATGVVTSYQYSTGVPAWTYTPVVAGSNAIAVDVSPANSTAGWTVDSVPPHAGGNLAQTTKIQVADGTFTQTVNYAPTLNTGTYLIYAYIPGSNTTETYGQNVEFQVTEEGATYTYTVNESAAGGWVQVGARRFVNVASTTAPLPLSVRITNGSTNAADVGTLAYADEVKFVGEQSQAISSTPIIATVPIWKVPIGTAGATEVQTQVVICADESGVIHCLDATGNTDGTTTEYWSYPSTLDVNGNDPNQVTGLDLDAVMPTGFQLSTALVAQPGGTGDYYLYIGATNGRVYCIDMAGRGDFGSATRTVGTTWRVWTYPATAPTQVQPTNNLGAFVGSITTNISSANNPDPANPTPLVFVPTTQGRMYALSATGTPLANAAGVGTGTAAAGSTTVAWAFPQLIYPTLGAINSTPAYKVWNGVPYLYFGTRVNTANNDSNGTFYCLNANTGLGVWSYSGGPVTEYQNVTTNGVTTPTLVTTTVQTGDFLSSPSVVPWAAIQSTAGPTGTPGGLVFVTNENNYVYAFDALNGVNTTTQQPWWVTNELNVGAIGSTEFSWMTVYNNAGIPTPAPVVIVPTQDGRFDALFADPNVLNVYDTRRAWEYITAAPEVASSVAISNDWMYGTDESGFLYAFNNGSGYESGGNPPGSSTVVENNPAGNIFRNASIKLITQAGYNLLRQPTGQNLDYLTATGSKYSFNRTPLAFEWGETVYILVYNFPFQTSNGTTTVAPPVVNITISAQGNTIRTQPVEAREFPQGTVTKPPTDPPDDKGDPAYPNGSILDNGYAILAFTMQGAGGQNLPPGAGNIGLTIATSSTNSVGAQQTIAQDPLTSNFPFYIANPLGISMPDPTNNNGFGTPTLSMGMSIQPSDAENLVNGSPLVPNLTGTETGTITNMLGASGGIANHGQSVTVPVAVYDRSMLASLFPSGAGLTNFRMSVNNLAWEAQQGAVYKPLPAYYVNFEDYPTNYPNNSIDYPDIQSMQVQVVANPNGAAQNPRFQPTTLNAPMMETAAGVYRPLQLGDSPYPTSGQYPTRVLVPTPVNLTINVPRFQPANNSTIYPAALNSYLVENSQGKYLNQGYLGRVQAFVDSNNNGLLDGTPSEAYRSFNLMTSVDVNEKLTISTPTVELGTLPQGTGFNPYRPGIGYEPGQETYSTTSQNGPSNNYVVFEPWYTTLVNGNLQSQYSGLFQPFVVNNEGNVNLLDVRLAKAYDIAQGNPPVTPNFALPWQIYSSSNDALGFLDGAFDVWSDIDSTFAPVNSNQNHVVFQKPRVTDVAPSQLTSNAIRRANSNLGTTGSFTPQGNSTSLPDVENPSLIAGLNGQQVLKYPPVAPRVAVSIPLGLPVGLYSQTMRVIENDAGNANDQIWSMFGNAPETYSDPTFVINFGVRETQLTSTFTPGASPMIDNDPTLPGVQNAWGASNAVLPGPNYPYGYSNSQPTMVRDPYGSLIVAWASDRPSWNPPTPTSANQLGNYSAAAGGGGLYLASVSNSASFSSTGMSNTLDPFSPLTDLDSFSPANTSQMFNPSVAAFPSQAPDQLFGSLTGEAVIGSTVQYGNPSFPQAGFGNPFNPGQNFQAVYMGFTGNAQKQTASGRVGESYIFVSTVNQTSGNAVGTPSAPVTMLNDPLIAKGKPSILQTSTGALVFYPGTGGSDSNVYYSDFTGTAFGPSIALPFGPGFQSITGASISGRVYNGVGSYTAAGTPILKNGAGIAELTFTALQSGQTNPEVFMGRMQVAQASDNGVTNNLVVVDDTGTPIDSTGSDGNAFIDFSVQTDEALVATGQPGTYRAMGVQWDTATAPQITQLLNGVYTPLLVSGTGVVDRQSGIVTFDSNLGGKVYIDPTLGTVRFATGVPNAAAQILATYTPRFLRVSTQRGAGFTKPIGQFDHRYVSNLTYWNEPNGSGAQTTDPITSDRFVFTYNRAAGGGGAGGAGLPARPYLSSFRLGVQLPYRIATNTNGSPVSVTVTAAQNPVTGQTKAISYYQVDPANARIYFTGADEDNYVTVTYTALSESGGTTTITVPSTTYPAPLNVSLVPEAIEQQILIDNPVNESDLTTFLDPFNYLNNRRPPLMWLFWTSARNGQPNIYFESLAPLWTSIPITQ